MNNVAISADDLVREELENLFKQKIKSCQKYNKATKQTAKV